MRNILAKELKIKFVETLSSVDGFSYEDGNPFLIEIYNNPFFIFLKNLSPAYFKNSPDVTRVQLPFSDHFDKIFKENIPFIILGYDVDNDTMVCWNPLKIKERLNEKNNVSLYSRNSLQPDTKSNEFRIGFLSNGEKIIIFKRENLQLFFEDLPNLFDNTDKNNSTIFSEQQKEYTSNKLFEITDIQLLKTITPLLEKNRVLETVEYCMKYYQGKYESMSFKDWFNLIKKHYGKQ
jgi:hypothetical protein